MKPYKEFIRNNALVSASLLLTQAQSLLFIPLVIKSSGAEVYGAYVLLNSFLILVFVVASLGVGFKYRRFLPSTTDSQLRARLFFPQVCFQFVSLAICNAVLLCVWPWISDKALKISVPFFPGLIIAFSFTYLIYSVGQDFFRYTHRMTPVAVSSFAYSGCTLLIVFLFFFSHRPITLNALLGAQVFSGGLMGLALGLKIFAEVGAKLSFQTVQEYSSDIRLGLPLVLSGVVDLVLSSSDRYIIAAYLSSMEVGYYAPAYSLGSLILYLPKVSGIVLPPLLSRASDSGHREESVILLSYTVRVFLFIAIPFVVGGAILGAPLLVLMANEGVAEAGKYVVPVVALATIFYGLNQILSSELFVQMKTLTMFKANAIAALSSLIMNLVFLYFFRSIVMAAVTALISYAISFAFICWSLAADFPFRVEWKAIAKSVISAGFMAGLMVGLRFILSSKLSLFGSTATLFAAGSISYVVALWMLGAVSRKEISYLMEAFTK